MSVANMDVFKAYLDQSLRVRVYILFFPSILYTKFFYRNLSKEILLGPL